MCAKDNHMFISHYHEDEEHITGMKELLGSSYKFKNSSVMSDKFNRGQDPDCITRLYKTLLRSRITLAKTVEIGEQRISTWSF